jgi:hypothetical protein
MRQVSTKKQKGPPFLLGRRPFLGQNGGAASVSGATPSTNVPIASVPIQGVTPFLLRMGTAEPNGLPSLTSFQAARFDTTARNPQVKRGAGLPQKFH